MRKPFNISAGLFAFIFAMTLSVSGTQAQGPGAITCPDGLIVYSGEQCRSYDTESVPQQETYSGPSNAQSSQSTAQSTTTIESSSQAAVDQPAAAEAPVAEAPTTEPEVITKEEEKGMLDYLPRPVKYLIEAAQALAS